MTTVKYCGTYQDSSGYGNANRNIMVALWTAGINVKTELVVQTPARTGGLLVDICNSLSNRDIPYNINIVHLTPDLYPKYKETGKYNIGHLFHETDKLPKIWIAACNDMDEIWTGTEEQKLIFQNSGVKSPIYVFPQPIYTQQAFENREPYNIEAVKDTYVFYSIFHWIKRKNPEALLKAYWKAFEGNDKVSLVIKTYKIFYNPSEYNEIRNDILRWKDELGLKHYPKVV